MKESWYANSFSKAYLPFDLSNKNIFTDLSIDPETRESISGRTAKHLTDP